MLMMLGKFRLFCLPFVLALHFHHQNARLLSTQDNQIAFLHDSIEIPQAVAAINEVSGGRIDSSYSRTNILRRGIRLLPNISDTSPANSNTLVSSCPIKC